MCVGGVGVEEGGGGRAKVKGRDRDELERVRVSGKIIHFFNVQFS